MMKNAIIFILILSLSILKTTAQELSESENSLFDNYLKSNIASEKEKIISDTLDKVVKGPVFKIKGGFSEENGVSFCVEYRLIIQEGNLIAFNSDNFMSVLRSDFSIKNEADAKIFETALDKLFPISWSNADKKEHLKKDNKWYFVRGTFFDSKSAYIVTLDQNGKITEFSYSMEAIKKE